MKILIMIMVFLFINFENCLPSDWPSISIEQFYVKDTLIMDLNIFNSTDSIIYLYNGSWMVDVTNENTLTIMGFTHSLGNTIKIYPQSERSINGFFESKFSPEFEKLTEFIYLKPMNNTKITLKIPINDFSKILSKSKFAYLAEFELHYIFPNQLYEIQKSIFKNNNIQNYLINKVEQTSKFILFDQIDLRNTFDNSCRTFFFDYKLNITDSAKDNFKEIVKKNKIYAKVTLNKL